MSNSPPKPFDPALMTSDELKFLIRNSRVQNITMDVQELRRRVYLRHPSVWKVAKSPRASLGDWDKLPPELQIEIFAVTSFCDLIHLRATNSQLKSQLEHWEPFRCPMEYGRDLVRALIASKAGFYWTAEEVMHVLFTSRCEICGTHGELIQLLRRKRCCLRCLSQERELLAVNYEYVTQVMHLTAADLEPVPALQSIPQKSFWGLPGSWGLAFDYQSALEVARERGHSLAMNSTTTTPTRHPEQHLMGAFGSGALLQPLPFPGERLSEELRSIQPRYKRSLQTRRGQPMLSVPQYEISPPETSYAQHACAVRMAGLGFKNTRLRDGTEKSVSSANMVYVSGVHCAGCAAYWNFHSPMPWQYHRLYAHDKSSRRDSEFKQHLRGCVYARLQWTLLHSNWGSVHEETVAFILSGGRVHFSRQATGDSHMYDNHVFEQLSWRVCFFMEQHEDDSDAFQLPYKWPIVDEPDEISKPVAVAGAGGGAFGGSNIPEIDYYWDSLVSQEAISQSNWACANMGNGGLCLFRGPYTLLAERRELYLEHNFPDGAYTHDQRATEWGFDRF
ncbi:hypothetical protein HRR83_009197 [Exophiala dermatitidis]|uniref:F-box domain-containing protein n=2 Tax=Exophiala dermatitidis TaxID=5970 RepID=H6BUS2_EXODN|nr:uncharacterized protein HMPREF1120_03883 [Exophiala dermatitidis NIH/UT8656]KAJ4502238.1 hypothetical protein HRR75_008567 [Exophiala dermatitidis]EHY55759.1 hypothetical protein HMPREF1120_03883 [Exophiala dermatitidis NIH/UT8656]KAJ4502989.1 hypothetical protein HRR73_009263 [Exophiala dermatitidis]KAJ4503412.1 hypothetical protein HRR74_009319 [Exophiala dermatitidis]KAJ4535433.1 hypothetical protein HRR77_008048 [Exophiala dermatitidis]